MPVGGTAIARALEAGRELLERDPKSKQHRRVMLLVTDGEDLEGDPVAVAESCKQADITIDVVQIGGRTPEPIPDVNEAGEAHGYRTDEQGKPLTTSLSAEGEEQLAKIASSTGGVIVQSARGETGITEISRRLGRLGHRRALGEGRDRVRRRVHVPARPRAASGAGRNLRQ